MKIVQDTHYLYLLNYVFSDRPDYIWRVLNVCDSVSDFKQNWPHYAHQFSWAPGLIAKVQQQIKSFDVSVYEAQLKQHHVKTVFYFEEAYPQLLLEISDPPVLLYYQGDLTCVRQMALGIVGTRLCSDYGEAVTAYFVRQLAPFFAIVSGLAKGIDTVAHQTALSEGQITIAVVATGLDIVYPDCNSELAAQIRKKGVILSEQPLGAQPLAQRFPQRNRIVSGLSKGVLICEAPRKSGALITARYAVEQNREVFAVPGSVFSELSHGAHRLIQDGAKLVYRIEDILEELAVPIPKRMRAQPAVPQLSQALPLFKENKEDAVSMASLSEEEQRVYGVLSYQPKQLDDIISETGLSVHQVLQCLTLFEMKQYVQQLTGKRFVKK